VAGGVTTTSDTDVTLKNDALIDVSAGVSAGEVELDALGGDLRVPDDRLSQGTFIRFIGERVRVCGSDRHTIAKIKCSI
jgi:hypothetical protein